MSKFNESTSPIQQPTQPNYADRQFLHTFLAGAFLPLVQATITAVMAGVGMVTLLFLINAIEILKPSLIVAAIVWVVTWLYLQRRWLNLTSLERLTGLDLNKDGQIGKPTKEPEQLVIRLDEISADKHFRSRRIDSVLSREQLTIVARGLLDGIPFAERRWTGEGKPLSINDFRALRSMWLKHGFLEVASDKDNRQGFYLTEQGWAVMEKLAGVTAGPEEEQSEIAELTDDELDAIRQENESYSNQFGS